MHKKDRRAKAKLQRPKRPEVFQRQMQIELEAYNKAEELRETRTRIRRMNWEHPDNSNGTNRQMENSWECEAC